MVDQVQREMPSDDRRNPLAWESGEGFRETLLLYFPEPRTNAALRRLGSLLFDLALEAALPEPPQEEGPTARELRAALADLRHLEGFLGTLGTEHVASSLGERDAGLSRLAAREARKITRVADRIEAALGQREDEDQSLGPN